MDTPQNPSSFKERLAEARKKQGLEQQATHNRPKPDQSSARSMIAFAFRLATEMLSALVVGVAIGWGLDYWLHTKGIFLIIFSFLGIASGVLNIWRLALKSKP
ncbi:AtpZ/AtpI family protein [Entomobacter blattae]|uniref:ATP synthase protein I n=1 Tax=Entomobacter blattae TaxID=2762277 RepID=A0A7H1NPQ7_9PROT|nr:AtpZ/AtpI family protein [Entomobacter blattae]QNT77767.1 ATP synthase protein I [Entomobacter blattae]